MRIGYYQFRPVFGNPGQNLQKVVKALKNVQADLIVLPELAFSGYYFKSRAESVSLSEDPKKSSLVAALKDLCADRKMRIITGFAEKNRDKVFNSALCIGPKGIERIYRKIHLFNEEKNWFDPGNTPLDVIRIGDAKVGIMICFDWIFPETARTLSFKGADIIAHPSNLVLNYCQQAMITRSIENLVYCVTANRIGADNRPQGSLKFTGQSQMIAPKGILLHRSARQKEELFITDIDLSLARNKRMTPKNDLFKDRRPLFYI